MNESQWISVKDRLPGIHEHCLIIDRHGDQYTAWREDYEGFQFRITGSCEPQQASYWMALPPPPKRESSFEKWWQCRLEVNFLGPGMREANPGSFVSKDIAQFVWDSAVAAARSPDYVP